MGSVQYTIRSVPDKVDRLARERANREHVSLNAVLIEALRVGLGAGRDMPRNDDLDDLAGTWVSDPEFDKAIASIDQVDEALWK